MNSFILMCEWLSIPSTEMAEKGASGGRCPREASSAPPYTLPKSHLTSGSARHLVPEALLLSGSHPAAFPPPSPSLVVISCQEPPTFHPGQPTPPAAAPAAATVPSPVGQVSPLLRACQPRLQQVPRGLTRHAAGDRPASSRLWSCGKSLPVGHLSSVGRSDS